jgi:hypothetical protein
MLSDVILGFRWYADYTCHLRDYIMVEKRGNAIQMGHPETGGMKND